MYICNVMDDDLCMNIMKASVTSLQEVGTCACQWQLGSTCQRLLVCLLV